MNRLETREEREGLITRSRWQMGPVFVVISNNISSGLFFNFHPNVYSPENQLEEAG